MSNNTTDKGINTQKDLFGDSMMEVWRVGSAPYQVPNMVVCFLGVDQSEEVGLSLTNTHIYPIYLFSSPFSKSTHYSLTPWKGRKGKMIIKSCDYDRETFASNWCVSAETHSERMMNYSWRTWKHLSLPTLFILLFFFFYTTVT